MTPLSPHLEASMLMHTLHSNAYAKTPTFVRLLKEETRMQIPGSTFLPRIPPGRRAPAAALPCVTHISSVTFWNKSSCRKIYSGGGFPLFPADKNSIV